MLYKKTAPCLILLAASSLVLGGCASLGSDRYYEEPAHATPNELVSTDFVNALVQVDGLNPLETTIQVDREPEYTSLFQASLIDRLRDAGYGIQLVPNGEGSRRVSSRITRVQDGNALAADAYEIGVGDVQMRREYRIEADGGILPVTALFVRGADASAIELNDAIFSPENGATRPAPLPGQSQTPGAPAPDTPADDLMVQSPADDASVVPGAPAPKISAAAPIATDVTPISGSTADQASVTRQTMGPTPDPTPAPDAGAEEPTRLSAAQAPAPFQPSESLSAQNSNQNLSSIAPIVSSVPGNTALDALSDQPLRNMRDIMGSNYQDVFNSYANVSEEILIFQNDSVRLGPYNRETIKTLANQFKPDSDIVSVIGCSHGPTGQELDNQTLALGRADTVRKALRYAGVPEEHILDEGCWAGDYFDQRFPRRGVVVTLKRAKS